MKTLWTWLNGKKTKIGESITCVALYLFATGVIDKDTLTMIGGILVVWFGVGIGHKIQKGELK